MVPVPSRVLGARRETADTVTLTLGGPGARPFRAGQFNMLYAFGVGEVAISMSGPPARDDVAIHTIKAVGAVTEALCRLTKGATVGVRGPYGAGWPMEEAKGRDVLVVAGGLGLAPLRPVVYQVLAERPAFGRLLLLAGARTPEDLLFRDELEAWAQRDGVTVLTTVDRARSGWKGRVGVVPALVAELGPLSPDTLAFVCGPEVMMRFTWRELQRRGVSEERTWLSMERNMKCAIGLCGHCQLGPDFICRDGPVLRYDRLRPRFWVKEY
jgi:NAD(P)H-flavin reductase